MLLKNFFHLACLLFLILSITTACAERKNLSPLPSISDQSKQQLKKPIDCANAKRDIAVLEDEKASVGKRMLSGVRSVFPISAAAGILMGDYSDRVEVATGIYNRDLENKIQEIRSTCGISRNK